MNLKALVPLLVALTLGGVAAKLGRDMMVKGRAANVAAAKAERWVAAKEDIAPGATIRDTDLELKDLPPGDAPTLAFHSAAQVIGRVVTSQVIKGQPIVEQLLAPKGALGGAQAMIPPGMRAVTLEVNEYSGVAGLLIPGSHVDVVQTMRGKGDETALKAKTIVENLTVIAVGRRTGTVAPANPNGGGGDELAKSVTVLATAEQAEVIDLASHMGSPRLVLRNVGDDKRGSGKGVTVAALRGEDEPSAQPPIADGGKTTEPVAEPVKADAPKPEAPPFREIEVIRGGASTTVKVPVPAAGPVVDIKDKLLGDR
jgi:pilus assembly protein CpaB